MLTKKATGEVTSIVKDAIEREYKLRDLMTPGCKWVCHGDSDHPCRQVFDSVQDALDHLEKDWNCFSHWMYEHPDGDMRKFPIREMHTSDWEGCYITFVQIGLNEPKNFLELRKEVA